VAKLKSRPILLGACTSCSILHGKIDEMHAYTISLEARLKEPISTSCSTRSLSSVLLLFNHWGSICFLCPSCWMRALRCCFGLVILKF
jgi:hypothetical protein